MKAQNVILFSSVEVFVLQNPSKECEPYRTSDKKPIAPCGAIANSLFNGKTNTNACVPNDALYSRPSSVQISSLAVHV